jgi:hypothetical protein
MDMDGPRRRCLRGLRGALRGILLRLAVAFLGRGLFIAAGYTTEVGSASRLA